MRTTATHPTHFCPITVSRCSVRRGAGTGWGAVGAGSTGAGGEGISSATGTGTGGGSGGARGQKRRGQGGGNTLSHHPTQGRLDAGQPILQVADSAGAHDSDDRQHDAQAEHYDREEYTESDHAPARVAPALIVAPGLPGEIYCTDRKLAYLDFAIRREPDPVLQRAFLKFDRRKCRGRPARLP